MLTAGSRIHAGQGADKQQQQEVHNAASTGWVWPGGPQYDGQ